MTTMNKWSTLAGLSIAGIIVLGRWNIGKYISSAGEFDWIDIRYLFLITLTYATISHYAYSLNTNNSVLGIRQAVFPTFAYCSLFLYLILAQLWASNFLLASDKSNDVLVLLVACINTSYWLGSLDFTSKVIKYSFYACCFIGLVGLITVIFNSASIGRLSVLGGGPNIFGRLMSVLVVYSMFQIPIAKKYRHFAWTTIALVGVVLIIMSGSRGALLGLSGGVISLIILYLPRYFGKKIMSVIMFAILIVAAIPFTPFGERAIEIFEKRIVVQTIGEGYTAGRNDIYDESLEMFANSPIIGAGLNTPFDKIGFYPHNIFLELGAEGGGIALIMFMAFLLPISISLVKKNHISHNLSFYIVVTYLISAQFSGDIYDSRNIFLFSLLTLTALKNQDPKEDLIQGV